MVSKTVTQWVGLLVLMISVIIADHVIAQEDEKPPRLGSADQTENRIDLDKLIKQPIFELHFLDYYFDFKKRLLHTQNVM